ncbi:MAG: 4Fe-4S binding protein [Clostridia bacterium]|nr:4Fe-4S binding protein [Clostridia bacterium]
MVGIYFSGTGNTKHCVQRLLQGIGGAEAYPLEIPQAAEAVKGADECPMQNIQVGGGKAKFNGKCTMCYRCFSSCPKQAITLIGKRVYQQSKYEKYADSEK